MGGVVVGGVGGEWQHLPVVSHLPLMQTGVLGTSGVLGTQHPWTLDQCRPPVWVWQSLPLGGEGGFFSPPWGRQIFLVPKDHSNSLALQAVLGVVGGAGGVGFEGVLQHRPVVSHFPFTQIGAGGAVGWVGTQHL